MTAGESRSVPLKAVLFDFGGTLDADGTTWPQRFYEVYRSLGVEVPFEDYLRAFYRSDDTLARRHDLRGLGLEETAALQAEPVAAELAPGRPGLGREAARRFAEGCRLNLKRNRPLLERLRRRYRLGIVSNFYGNLEGLVAAEGLGALFGAVADSAAVGATKPEAGIFLHALERLGAAPAEALMVGDSLARDMRGAEALGMPHAWLCPPPAGPCCARGRVIGSIMDLERLLEPDGVAA